MIAYPLAGQIGANWSQQAAFGVLGALAAIGLLAALLVWPSEDSPQVAHVHDDLPRDHPHLQEHQGEQGKHAHDFVIDDLHVAWPGKG